MTSHKLSVLKSIVWRLMGVVVLFTVTYTFTGELVTTTYITFAHHATFLLVFYLHERLWKRVYDKDTKLRKVAKAFTYEIILGMGIGGLIILLFTGEWSKVSVITPTYTAIKLIMYYLYEKVWTKVEDRYE